MKGRSLAGNKGKKAIPILYTVINDAGYGKALFWEVGEDLSYPFYFTSHAYSNEVADSESLCSEWQYFHH